MAENTEVKNEETVEKKKTPAKKASTTKKTTSTAKKTTTKATNNTKKTTTKRTTKKEEVVENKSEKETTPKGKKTTTKKASTTSKSATTKKTSGTTKKAPAKKSTTENKASGTKKEVKKVEEKKEVKDLPSKTAKSKTTKSNSTKTKKAVNQNIKLEEEKEIEIEEAAVIEEPKIAIKMEDIKKAIKSKKKVPAEEMYKINKAMFKNIIMAVAVILYFLFLNLGFLNIDNDVYVTDLKVFSMCILLLAIILLEMAYKKDNGEIGILGVETIFIALVTLGLIYVNLMMFYSYVAIVASISFIFAIYYLLKTIIIYLKGKKKYFVNNIKEIINPEE